MPKYFTTKIIFDVPLRQVKGGFAPYSPYAERNGNIYKFRNVELPEIDQYGNLQIDQLDGEFLILLTKTKRMRYTYKDQEYVLTSHISHQSQFGMTYVGGALSTELLNKDAGDVYIVTIIGIPYSELYDKENIQVVSKIQFTMIKNSTKHLYPSEHYSHSHENSLEIGSNYSSTGIHWRKYYMQIIS